MTRTVEPPFPDTARTGRSFISPCCTASVAEFLVDGTLRLAGRVAGHGWSEPWHGSIDGINDTGTVVEADGTERRVFWSDQRDGSGSRA